MRSFASVAVDEAGCVLDQFEARLFELPDAVPDAGTLEWLRALPDVWAELQRDPKPAGEVMTSFVAWLRALPMRAVFVANPLIFDAVWIDWYLRRFAGVRLHCGPYGGEHLFLGTGVDLPSLVMGTLGWPYERCRWTNYPAQWFGGQSHTHKAIDDALGYAHVLSHLLKVRRNTKGPA